MGASPATTNQTASVINAVLKNIIEGAGLDVIEATLIAEVPWLGWPVIKQIMELILNKAADLLYTQAANAATKIVIDVQVNVEQSKVLNAFQNLQMAIASGDQNAISKASSDLDDAYGSLIHSDGSAPA